VNNDDALPVGSLAYRKYEFTLNGEDGSIALTLGDPNSADPIAVFAIQAAVAINFGMINVLGYSDGPSRTLVWALTSTELMMIPSDEDDDVSPGLHDVISKCLAMFFDEVAPLAPDLAGLRLSAVKLP
jgi:hypothetical protein